MGLGSIGSIAKKLTLGAYKGASKARKKVAKVIRDRPTLYGSSRKAGNKKMLKRRQQSRATRLREGTLKRNRKDAYKK